MASLPTSRQISSGAAFSVDGMAFAYPESRRGVFERFSLKARPGEFVAVLGPSGCGKSTLLNLLSGFLRPQSGHITIDGAPVAPEHPALGYVFQSPNLFPWLSVLENVRFGLRMNRRGSPQEQRAVALNFLRLVGLEEQAEEPPHRLSGGQRQRVALARSLALEPRLLLMDEPFATLDAMTRATLNDELLLIWSSLGQTVLFITHDIDEAVYLADRVLVLGFPPAGIMAEVAIDLPRPRDQRGTRANPLFAELRERLSEEIAKLTAGNKRVI
ncbi:ABC transporter ATP-binding protein [Rhizobium leucaenae]|uniref:NitT/TauT family transport system ATP-binding protein n=1 Tax=Rhizobium leucaenae TaxID=29450 RepID=A0A7W6ZZN9_9HYPH|nr:ABC transporter ATP-binding protein [Rhizobium leucaenae]MBB4571762.1 NitT/TauT family transport system ATP-binding protein [Rhizobium leucaenae]MBB6305646.1 NitT/TauT family transport system ATP-binding protein [Rhizobium leucaenae]